MSTDRMLTLGFVIPGDLNAPTGGSRYDREVLTRFANHPINAHVLGVSSRYPFPTLEDRNKTATLLSTCPCDLLLMDGLAFGAFSEIERAAMIKPLIVLLHHPLADETGLSADIAQQFYELEKSNLRLAQMVIVTSQATKLRLINAYEVDEDQIIVAEPAITRPPFLAHQKRQSQGDPCLMLAVGSISPRKNYSILIKALARIKTKRAWVLNIAGRCDDQQETQKLKTLINELGLGSQINLLDTVSETVLQSLYQDSDFLLFPSLYEGYGMALTEALSYGLPVIASVNIPAATGLKGDAVQLIEPEKTALWAETIEQWMNDKIAFTKAVETAKGMAATLPDWDQTTLQIVQAVKKTYARVKGSS